MTRLQFLLPAILALCLLPQPAKAANELIPMQEIPIGDTDFEKMLYFSKRCAALTMLISHKASNKDDGLVKTYADISKHHSDFAFQIINYLGKDNNLEWKNKQYKLFFSDMKELHSIYSKIMDENYYRSGTLVSELITSDTELCSALYHQGK